ncbi:hypothetical protein HYV11_02220 [Candidatus Dependentiae bacterium]|nr:hypothetical protein [Candidatus Dependentiae bacterium]
MKKNQKIIILLFAISFFAIIKAPIDISTISTGESLASHQNFHDLTAQELAKHQAFKDLTYRQLATHPAYDQLTYKDLQKNKAHEIADKDKTQAMKDLDNKGLVSIVSNIFGKTDLDMKSATEDIKKRAQKKADAGKSLLQKFNEWRTDNREDQERKKNQVKLTLKQKKSKANAATSGSGLAEAVDKTTAPIRLLRNLYNYARRKGTEDSQSQGSAKTKAPDVQPGFSDYIMDKMIKQLIAQSLPKEISEATQEFYKNYQNGELDSKKLNEYLITLNEYIQSEESGYSEATKTSINSTIKATTILLSIYGHLDKKTVGIIATILLGSILSAILVPLKEEGKIS